ncbi:hypothetical protein BKA60DRAFT_310135 [Fusarium oxysporum]|nr:hypothetical protein BKA60DRAFT_310135 [Fusarium oxysporum]
MLNPNDITNPIKLKLTACRTRETEEAEKFLGLDQAYKRARLAISDSVTVVWPSSSTGKCPCVLNIT